MLPLIAAAMMGSGSALAARTTYGVPQEPAVSPGQEDPAPVPQGAVPGVCDHAAGEFLVGYASEETLHAAPPENVVETFGGILAQHLAFAEIKNIPDPAERFAAEEAKRQEIEPRPGVAYAEYNCVATTQAASTEEARPLTHRRRPAAAIAAGTWSIGRRRS